MSSRREVSNQANSKQDLQRVLEIGLRNQDAAAVGCGCGGYESREKDEELSEPEFMAMIDKLVEVEARGMTRDDRASFKQVAKEQAKKRASQAGRITKEGVKGAGKLTRKSAQALVTEVNIMWLGAKKPAHWLKLSAPELSSRFKKSLRTSLTKPAWENILKAEGGDRYYTCDSSANCHADVNIFDATEGKGGVIKCKVFVKFKDDPKTDEEMFLSSISKDIFGEATEDLGDSVTMSYIKYEEILKRCDRCLDVATRRMKDKLANFM